MMIIGLTGGIGMGKSTVAKILRELGFPIYSADQAVHDIMKKGGKAMAPVAKLFPEVIKRGAIDRQLLGRAVFGQPKKLRQLEKIIHPLIRDAERAFLQKARKAKASAVILEIPLLFETKADKRCDVTLSVTAPRAIQKARVLARPNMTEEKFHAILSHQMPDSEKRKKADHIIPTGTSLHATEKHIYKILGKLDLLD
jgi:dephospho-CoA kinase